MSDVIIKNLVVVTTQLLSKQNLKMVV